MTEEKVTARGHRKRTHAEDTGKPHKQRTQAEDTGRDTTQSEVVKYGPLRHGADEFGSCFPP